MLNLTLTLTWPDGSKLVARMNNVETPQHDYPIHYSGDVSRLRDPQHSTTAPFLASHLRSEARRTGATFTEDWDGKYERFAE